MRVATATLTGLSATGSGAAAVVAVELVPHHPVLAAGCAAVVLVVLSSCVGALVGRGLARHLRRVASDLALVTDGALDELPLVETASAGRAAGSGQAAGAGRGRARPHGSVRRRRARPAPARPLPVREMQRLGDAFVALGARVRLADDLAERHRQEAEAASRGMVEMLSGLVAAEEGARGQLSAELHDTAAQSLATARRLGTERTEQREAVLSLPRQAAARTSGARGGARRGARGGPSDTAEGDSVTADLVTADLVTADLAIADLVAEAEDALRATMARARPPALHDGDLAAAVTLLRDDLEFRYGLDVALHWPSKAYPVPLAVAVTVYRFFQEALLNVVKHADVDTAVASLAVDERHVVAVVHDAGTGFAATSQPAAGVGGRHVGLGLLRERARLAGGGVLVQSAPGSGTTLTLRLPRPALPLE